MWLQPHAQPTCALHTWEQGKDPSTGHQTLRIVSLGPGHQGRHLPTSHVGNWLSLLDWRPGPCPLSSCHPAGGRARPTSTLAKAQAAGCMSLPLQKTDEQPRGFWKGKLVSRAFCPSGSRKCIDQQSEKVGMLGTATDAVGPVTAQPPCGQSHFTEEGTKRGYRVTEQQGQK